MAIDKRYVHQWQQLGGPACDDRTKHWTEVSMTVDDLAAMIGCASGSVLISLHIDRSGQLLTLTFDEHQEPPCSPVSSKRPSGQQPGSPPA
jgi:hypothetical protein